MIRVIVLSLMSAALLVFAFGCSKNDDNHDGNNNSMPQEVILTIQPADGATNIPQQSAVVVTFDHSMMMDSLEHMFMLHTGWGVSGEQMVGAFTWNDDQTVMTFQPSQLFAEDVTYTIHFEGMMMDMDGMMMHPMMDTTMGMGEMHSGDMMGGMSENEIVSVFSTGPEIVHQTTLDLTGDVVLVANGGSGDITAIDPATNTVVGIQPLDTVGFLHHLYYSPDRAKLLVSDPNEDLSGGHSGGGGHSGHHGGESMISRIVVLDSRTLLETGRIIIDGMAHNGIMTPDGETILLANAVHGMIHKYSAATLQERGSYSVGSGPLEVTITPDGLYALSTNSEAGTVSKIHLVHDMPIEQISVGSGPIGAWITSDGQKAWVTNEESRSVTVITIEPLAVDTTLNLGYTPGQAITNPTRDEVYVADEDNGSVHVYDLQTSQFVAEIPTGARAHGIAFNPDGSRAFVTNELGNSVSVIDCATRAVVSTIAVGTNPNGIVFRSAL